MTPDLVEDLSSQATALACLALFVFGLGHWPLVARLLHPSRAVRRAAPNWLVAGASVIAIAACLWLVPNIVWQRRLYVGDGREVTLTTAGVRGVRVVKTLAGRDVTRVIVWHWTGSGAKNVPRKQATLAFETSGAPRAIAMEVAPATADERGREMARRLGVPFATFGP